MGLEHRGLRFSDIRSFRTEGKIKSGVALQALQPLLICRMILEKRVEIVLELYARKHPIALEEPIRLATEATERGKLHQPRYSIFQSG